MTENTFARAFRVGIAGPVGSGKTALVDCLSKRLWPTCELAVVTNDIYTKEDAEFLLRAGTLPAERIRGVETGGCPHAAIREDASMNLEAIADLEESLPGLELVFVESGGDNLAAAFSPELVDVFIYVIDVSGGDKIPRKGGPGITRAANVHSSSPTSRMVRAWTPFSHGWSSISKHQRISAALS